MDSVQPPGGLPDHRPLVLVTSTGDRHHVTVLPGADPEMIVAAVAPLTPCVYLTCKRTHDSGPDGVVLVFRSLPTAITSHRPAADPPTVPAGLPTGPATGWVPEVAAPAADIPAEVLGAARSRHDHARVPAWWTTVWNTVVAGPWADRRDAVQAGADDPDARAVYGRLQPDGTIAVRPAPEDLAWERHLSAHVDRLRDDHGGPVHALTDDIAGLAVRVAGALVAAGVPIADVGGAEPHGGALVVPARHAHPAGVAISWAAHPHLPTLGISDETTANSVPDVMTYALASLLGMLGFQVRRGPGTRTQIVTGGPGR
jgi:hypothetical protein